MKKAVIFDVDGVIVFSEKAYQKRRAIFFEKNGLPVSQEVQEHFVGSNAFDMFEQLIPADIKKREELLQAYQEFRRQYPINYQEMFNPDILSTLDGLVKKGIRLAVASSGPLENIYRILEVNQIKNYFELITSGEMFARSKPNPEIYQYTVSKLDLQPSDCLVIEDSAFGIEAARRANLSVAALKSQQFAIDQSQATYQIESTKQLLDLI
ncbi:HAD family hydrolase [Tetragenococcus koreensis]|uniref:Beta-phosphoglucomutase n=1 Tax=Tetragenococcus koreensis TaxID=290335 RepID=A0AAN4RJD2_9ENTE|nr:HAD family phosphatase [Tetragenococcus koreensis]MCF1621310.1 HAD family phosphatase [Tetragenococcus koreensis]MCF1626440.1 HAD family phosphatase [Tetragenococcus koreensis]MCF1632367.1 HAD family phosphatase [Tetragenococcus koreensis]MCF1677360.1 HAD family phosphatase [Tetragenococcus koreensis]MCF1679769.1 HAD family phosphatase [Tetragenococcus koreensis]